MLALAATKAGDFRQSLSLEQVDAPTEIGPNELLIKVAWSDLNPVDLQKLQQRTGDAPFVTGFAGSGTVEQTSDASAFPVGSCICFLVNPSQRGSYAQYCVVDRRAAAILPNNVSLKEAASVPLAGCTAYESLMKMGLGDQRNTIKSLLIVGGSGGVGSWATRIAQALRPDLQIICTASSQSSSDWCKTNGASRCIPHDAIDNELSGGPKGCVDAILCLTEPTPSLISSMAEVIRPYGSICLVVAGPSIRSLNLDFVFFKSATVYTETVFSCFRTHFSYFQPNQVIAQLLDWISSGKIAAPLSPWLEQGDPDWTKATASNGILEKLGHVQGKLVMQISDRTE